MKIYLAGKIYGNEDYKQQFKSAARRYSKGGQNIILNPAVMPEGLKPNDYMRMSFAMIDAADMVVFLDGWRESRGAMLEFAYCAYIDKPTFDESGVEI